MSETSKGFEGQIVAPGDGSGPPTVTALSAGVDTAIRLLRQGRYGALDLHLHELEQQAAGLQALRQALGGGLPRPAGLRQSCEQLGRRLFVLSEVAKSIMDVECGLAQLMAAPPDAAYGRDGQCGSQCGGQTSLTRFQLDA